MTRKTRWTWCEAECRARIKLRQARISRPKSAERTLQHVRSSEVEIGYLIGAGGMRGNTWTSLGSLEIGWVTTAICNYTQMSPSSTHLVDLPPPYRYG